MNAELLTGALLLGLALSACTGTPSSRPGNAGSSSASATSTAAAAPPATASASAGAPIQLTVLDPATTLCANPAIQALATKYKFEGFDPAKLNPYVGVGDDNGYLNCRLGTTIRLAQTVLPVDAKAFDAGFKGVKSVKIGDAAFLGTGWRESGVRVGDRAVYLSSIAPDVKIPDPAKTAVLTQVAALLPSAPQPPSQVNDPRCDPVRALVNGSLGGAPAVVSEGHRDGAGAYTSCSYLLGKARVEANVQAYTNPAASMDEGGSVKPVEGLGTKATWEPAVNTKTSYVPYSTLTVAYSQSLLTVRLTDNKGDAKQAAIALAKALEPLAK